jgi:ribosomal protein S18 acetylase RimI-like enzyme
MGYIIRPLTGSDIKAATGLFVEAFKDRPFYRYIAPDAGERLRFLESNFEGRLKAGLSVNEIQACLRVTDGVLCGAAMWQKPYALLEEGWRRSMEDALSPFSAGTRERFLRFLDVLHAAEKESVKQPFWALAPIAVLPCEQGKGAGGLLLRSKLSKIDEEKTACFLGTQDEINVEIYKRFGFKKTREDALAEGLTHYTMVRSIY